MRYESLSPDDRELVERQLGRELRGEVGVASRCLHGEVQVIATPPVLPDGTPFPTLYWLTCPLLRGRVSRLESRGFRRHLGRKLAEEPGFAASLRRAEEEYALERETWAEEMGELGRVREYFSHRGGIGGTKRGGIKCLHAHLAHYLSGGDNPVGAEVALALEGVVEGECGGDCGPFLKEE